MEFQERAIHRPDLVFLDEMMLELDEIEEENDLIEQENWENGLVFFKNWFDRSLKSSLIFFDDIRKLMCETKSGRCLVQRVNRFSNFLKRKILI